LEELDDGEMDRLVNRPIRRASDLPIQTWQGDAQMPLRADLRIHPAATLLCGMTDSFPAQARASRLALHLRIPYLSAQVYAEGLGAEIVFLHPDGPNSACPRCILETRYRAHLQEGFVNHVGSRGSPIGTTTHLNGLKFTIGMALLHYGRPHTRWGALLDTIGPRNLIQIRMHPSFAAPVFEHLSLNHQVMRFGEPLFFNVKPIPNCPDCGGAGNLRSRKGAFIDTRVLE